MKNLLNQLKRKVAAVLAVTMLFQLVLPSAAFGGVFTDRLNTPLTAVASPSFLMGTAAVKKSNVQSVPMDGALVFSSEKAFSIEAPAGKRWTNKLYYGEGLEWDGDTQIITSVEVEGKHCIYIKGIHDDDDPIAIGGFYEDPVTYEITYFNWNIIAETDVCCDGDLALLLDSKPEYQVMAEGCFSFLFLNCSKLVKAPSFLTLKNLTIGCYASMFSNCDLREMPELYSIDLPEFCYESMFNECRNLSRPKDFILPESGITKLGYYSMASMFYSTGLSITNEKKDEYNKPLKPWHFVVQSGELPFDSIDAMLANTASDEISFEKDSYYLKNSGFNFHVDIENDGDEDSDPWGTVDDNDFEIWYSSVITASGSEQEGILSFQLPDSAKPEKVLVASPSEPTVDSIYKFIRWENVPAAVDDDTSIKAVFGREDRYYDIDLETNDDSKGVILDPEKKPVSDTLKAKGNSTISVNGNTITVAGLTYSAQPVSEAYLFDHWEDAGGNKLPASTDITVDDNFTFKAVFTDAPLCAITLITDETTPYGIIVDDEGEPVTGTLYVVNGSTVTTDDDSITIDVQVYTAVPNEDTSEYHYEFSAWLDSTGNPLPASVKITGDTVIKASFASITREYTVTWENYDGSVLETDTGVPYGATPSYDSATPEKPATAEYTYTFAGWDPAVAIVTEDAVYTAQFTSQVNTYPVTWKNYDGSVLETDDNVPYGTVPTYDAAAPVKPATTEYTYSFKGWTPDVTAVTGPAEYTAVFDEHKIQVEPSASVVSNVPVSETDPEAKKQSINEILNNTNKEVSGLSGNIKKVDELIKSIPGVDAGKVTATDIKLSIELNQLALNTEQTKVASLQYEIHPAITVSQQGQADITAPIPNTYLNGQTVKFHIPVPAQTSGAYADLEHVKTGGSTKFKLKIQGEGGTRYVEVSVTEFSTFILSFTDTYYTISPIPDQTYTGSEIKPAVIVKDGDNTVDSSLYTYSYANNIAVGTATVLVTILPTGDQISADFTIKSSGGGGGGGGSSGGGGGSISTLTTATLTFSPCWLQDVNGIWRCFNPKKAEFVKNAWLCDDAVPANGLNVWYLMNADGTMLAAPLVRDNTGHYYSLETEHNGYFGSLRYKNGTYDGIYMEFSQAHDGSFGAITNQAAIDALNAKYGTVHFPVDNASCVYTSTFYK